MNLLQAQFFEQQDCEILPSVKNTMADLPGGISFFSTSEFAANIDPCEPFTGVELHNSGWSQQSGLSLPWPTICRNTRAFRHT